MSENERTDTKIATIYGIRLSLTQRSEKDGKTEYTLQELCEMLDKMAIAAAQK